MQYSFTRNGVKKIVPKERWCWEAYYDDGQIFKQFSDNGDYHFFREIDQSKLSNLTMRSSVNPDKIFTVTFHKGLKLIHYYNDYTIDLLNSKKSVRVYCFGYSQIVKDPKPREILTLNMILPNDYLITTDDKNIKLFG